MKTWFKGGLIGLGIGIFILITGFTFTEAYENNLLLKIISVPFYLSASFADSFFYVPDDTATAQDYELNNFVFGFLGIFFYFLLGSLIGLIIQKFMEKRK